MEGEDDVCSNLPSLICAFPSFFFIQFGFVSSLMLPTYNPQYKERRKHQQG